jgi:hypothetical protein
MCAESSIKDGRRRRIGTCTCFDTYLRAVGEQVYYGRSRYMYLYRFKHGTVGIGIRLRMARVVSSLEYAQDSMWSDAAEGNMV